MRYLSVCSGIEAASVAWHHLGWKPVGFSEIEAFPSAVLAHRFPNVPNFGDMTRHAEWNLGPGSVDLLVGGTPCQSFSVAGLRKGLSDSRGGLMLTYLEIAQRLRPRWVVWENVPGVLSSNGGRDFGSFLGALGELGYGWAYRVLDAQWVRTQRHPRAVPQRRRRVFVVGCLIERCAGDWAAAAQVLFERESVCRDSAPRRASREGVAADAEAGVGAGCYWDGSDCAGTLTKQNANGAQRMPDKDNFGAVLQPLGYRWQNNREGLVEDGTAPACRASAGSSGFHEMNHPVVVQTFTKSKRAQSATDDESWVNGQVNPTLSLFDQGDTRATTVAVGFNWQNGGGYGNANDGLGITVEGTGPLQRCNTPAVAHALRGEGFDAGEDGTGRGTPLVAQAMTVRRLTPRECERLQGFPDDWTMIPWRKKGAEECPDGPRYKALGNSMAVNVMAWIGERIAGVEARSAGNL